MKPRLDVIGAPSSAGAYAPGQERAPEALRAAGLLNRLRARGVRVTDRGDVPGFRWRVDREHPEAMHAEVVARVARSVADRVAFSMADDATVLVLGGDCTVELGTVSGAVTGSPNVGLVYVDLDTDLNTPATTMDGALDWMGVAHLLGLPGSVPELAELGPRSPLLDAGGLVLFAADNSEPFERDVMWKHAINTVPLSRVASDPVGAARDVVRGWGCDFERLLIHLDVDVLDFFDLPIAENVRRNRGLRFEDLLASLRELVAAPNFRALTVCEVNPDHGEADGATVAAFAAGLADVLASALGQTP